MAESTGKSVATGGGGIGKLFSRPKTEYIGKVGEEIVINSQPSDLIFLRKCERCKVSLKKKAAKIIIDSCIDLEVELEMPLMSGTMELVDCQGFILKVSPQVTLPTLSAERCHNFQLSFDEPAAMDSIYTVQCSDFKVCFQHPDKVEKKVVFLDDNDQYVIKYTDGFLNTSLVVREEGGYATVEEEFWTQREKEAQMRQFIEVYLRQLISFKPKEGEETSISAAVAAALAGGGGATSGGDGDSASGGDEGRKPFSSNIKDVDEKKEFFDSEEELSKKLDLATEWLKNSKHTIIFTGAGVSTSCGIPDYRSGMDTVLKTGPGVWELAAYEAKRPEGASVTPIINALPSPTHMAIVQLHKEGRVKHTISQNIDGLHRRSGLRRTQLAELHGNTNLETCEKCGRQYLRDFETRMARYVFDHTTSRRCDDPSCKGILNDSIINFGEALPEAEITTAFKEGEEADLCIVLGSSLRVSPANHVPLTVHKRGQKVVICNLQKIPDYSPDENTMQVFAKCDNFMEGLCERLGVRIPPFVLHRRAQVVTEDIVGEGDGEKGVKVTVTGLDVDEDLPYSFIKAIAMEYDKQIQVDKEPLSILLPPECSSNPPSVRLQCQGHYGEPTILLECPPVGGKVVYRMAYEVLARGNWVITKENEEEQSVDTI